MHLIKVLFISLASVFMSLNLMSQNTSGIQWGQLEKFRGNTQKIVNINGQNFTVVVDRVGFFSGLLPNRRKLILREVNGLNTVSEKKHQLRGANRNLAPAEINGLNNQLIAISQRPRVWGGKNEMFTHTFNLSHADKNIEGEQLISYFVHNAPTQSKQIGMINSDDFSKVAAFYTIPVGPGEFPGFGYVLYDQSKGKYAQQVTQLPYVNFQLDFSDAFISNNGDFYVLANEYYLSNPQMPWSPNNRFFAKVRAFRVIDGKFSEFEINQNGFIIQNMKMTTDEQGNFVCSGFYADDLYSGVRGVFFMNLDRNTNELVTIKKQPFSQDFLSTGLASWEQSWRDRWRANQNKPQALADFVLLDFRATADGGYLAITENQSIVVTSRVTGTAENPTVKYTENFYFDDIIVYKLDAQGNLTWVKRIAKNQQSINDRGRNLSVAHAVSNSSVYLYFNDVQRNYNSDGGFRFDQNPFPVQFISGNNVIGVVEFDLNTGTFTRKALPGLNANRVIFIPQKCEYNYETNEMIFYGQRNRRHRFGHAKLR